MPDGLTADRAAFVTLGSIALEALRRSGRTLGETIVVFGCGVLGVLITMLARAAGIYIIAVDPDPERRNVAAASGAMLAADGHDGALVELGAACCDETDADAAVVKVAAETSDGADQRGGGCAAPGRRRGGGRPVRYWASRPGPLVRGPGHYPPLDRLRARPLRPGL